MRLLSNCLLFCLLLLSLSVTAKSTDRDQPLHIEADSVEIRELEGISIYKGNVSINQGSIQIHGELIHIHTEQQGLQKILVEGQPATFKQLNDQDEEVSASSNKMTYEAGDGSLVLKEEAVLVQGKNRFTSDHIIYDTRQDIVQAGNENNSTSSDEPKRVTITIHPEASGTQDKQDQNKQPQ